MEKKQFKIMLSFVLCISLYGTTLIADTLQTQLDSYLAARYNNSSVHHVADYEQVSGIYLEGKGNDNAIVIVHKNGAQFRFSYSNWSHAEPLWNSIRDNYKSFKIARENLLKEASKDISSMVRVQTAIQ